MRTSDFDYELPEELIAQNPPEHRTDSRMLVLDSTSGEMEILPFPEIRRFFRPGDALAMNDTKVIRARLFALKETGAKIEIMLLHPGTDGTWTCFAKPGKRMKEGSSIELLTADGKLSGHQIETVSKTPEGEVTIRFLSECGPDPVIALCGHVPLPPYIRRQNLPPDAERYQTVYAAKPGAVAAPTAGLHFSKELLADIASDGVQEVKLTLHVGAGTFKPVSAEEISDHKMHTEDFVFPTSTCEILNQTRTAGGRIAAVGTTTLRVLESCVNPDGSFSPRSGETGIFIYPPYKVLSADILLTNFHLPKSTLLMLVSAFAGMENIRRAYQLAIREKMRFFSYGDCMLIINKPAYV